MTDLSKVLGARWKELGADERKGFEESAKKLAEQYKEDKAKYDEENPKVGRSASALGVWAERCTSSRRRLSAQLAGMLCHSLDGTSHSPGRPPACRVPRQVPTSRSSSGQLALSEP